MAKSLFLLLGFLYITTVSSAQNANTLFFGAKLLDTRVADHQVRQEQNIQARVGFFATDRLAMGLCLEAGRTGNEQIPFGMSFFARYYAGKKGPQTVKFFIETGAGVADHKLQSNTDLHVDNHWIKPAVYFSPGINIFPCKAVALELSPEYKYIGGGNSANRLAISAGIHIFLSEKLFKYIFPTEFHSLY